MDLAFAFLCDYADQSSGKLTAVGIGFDTIYARDLPVSHPSMYAVIGLRFASTEVGVKRLGLRIIDSDGTNIVPPLDSNINVEQPPVGYINRNLRVALGLHGVIFKSFGDYAVSFLLDGREVGRVPFKVSVPPKFPQTV